MQPIADDLVRSLRDLFLRHTPHSHARMLQPGARYKFANVHHPPTDKERTNHLAGSSTIAVPLIGAGELACHAAVDIDHGGAAALHHCLDAATNLGYQCVAVTSSHSTHDGGHLWMFFDALTHPERLRQCMQQVLRAAQVETREIHPLYQSLRLPFGQHTWTRERGRMLFPDGDVIDLDTGGIRSIQAALACLTTLPRNQVERLPQVEVQSTPNRTAFVRGDTSHIAAYNQATDLVRLLENYGGRVAERWRNRVLMHCPCGNHAHNDMRASLWLQAARRPEVHGLWVAVGLAPSCRFYTERGRIINAFNVFCSMEDLTPTEAVERIREQEVC